MDRGWHRREGCFLGSTENSQSSLSDSSNTYRQLWSVAKGRAWQGRAARSQENLGTGKFTCRSASLPSLQLLLV